MVQLELYNDAFTLESDDLIIEKYPKLFWVECKMKIVIDNQIFYDDWINPLELYFQYKNWYRKVCEKNLTSFYYNTIDHNKNPIIALIFDYKENRWSFDGTFKNYYEKKTFTTKEVLDLFEQFETQLLTHIK